MIMIRELLRRIKVDPINKVEDCDFILLFCSVPNRPASDVKAAMDKVPDKEKPVILVTMSYERKEVETITFANYQKDYKNIRLHVNIFYHETTHLDSPNNHRAIEEIKKFVWEKK
ncbi:hypothetical protein NL108_011756 [Boleophthalmus pectinirostris]|nr:hypothetical protein NL108_011756 [Boleophthalmus pectinirostris]